MLLEIHFTLLSWITGIIMLMLEAFSVVGNASVVFVIFLDPLKNIRRSPSNHLVLTLAMADLLVGTVICFFSGMWYIHYAAYKEDLCMFYNAKTKAAFPHFELVTISTTNQLVLGIDRLIAIKVPLRYSYSITKRRMRIVIVFIWVYFCGLATILIFFPLKGTVKKDFIFNCCFMVAFVGLVINCGIVIHALRKQSIAMKRLCGCFNAIRNTVEREKKVIKGSIIITVVFIAYFVPFFICQLLQYLCVICWIKYSEVVIVFRIIAQLLGGVYMIPE